MNSYYKANRDMRETYLKEKKEGIKEFSSEYPKNINFKNFF